MKQGDGATSSVKLMKKEGEGGTSQVKPKRKLRRIGDLAGAIRRTEGVEQEHPPPRLVATRREDGLSDEWDACAICDDGGELIWCEGGCLRSFHPIKICGLDSMCTSLGLTEEHWQTLHANKQEKYICKNCENKQHQCFACGLLGSSDLISGSEVFKCKEKNCGHFYHPKCVAELLYPDSKGLAIYFEEHVASGLEFHCLMHRCSLCKEAENRDDTDMQLAVCRRCPTAYHRKCLPSDISFIEDNDEGTQQRAWDNILPDQILIYCMKHEIDKDLGTPKRDHIVFPDDRPLSEPPQSSQPAEMGSDRVKGIDSFASKHLFPHPQPGSCGWIDD
ncbi:protein ENHANCED DOWNY MILDEW 2 isoform X2 [Brachypodium distachyon]|nr:protein ENHANCED DOWNY MILDEW 2 isoform X2 [Brachypodium distachyon]XP_014758719.1 protein ENHANCED DOWNY MILDEW 2 isoform X2 [Brachypodium distachyon]XP_024310450.1 protein ENHANCED DOWNY MILDEW 2 isoform X2 [Brachypodium distachyon]KQJ91833.1 hypothetical protein BRADI_4g40054v3 [Brachypodium distachyon]KQJ91834.1 hypothetical protein BRADI_4g40054v3 [Brachypodium distachyon]KQJ91835.1 hypothetical protein BRADI_4g40054v3 [Brachypodium distachyon]KQJ91836.1 hypothetical protein BRADI_4g4|eukprot:XP_003576954.1 protein ENHANCED DOWNY MILDEW 2 isoform X2 [Brachypodium distachyon]